MTHSRSTISRRALGRYIDRRGRTREVLAARGAAGSIVVLDRDAGSRGDRRLVAHLAADEPLENAALVCRCYIDDARAGGRCCRALTEQDMLTVPFLEEDDLQAGQGRRAHGAELRLEASERCYGLERVTDGMSIPQLRWCRWPARCTGGEREVVSLREVIAALESYDPPRAITRGAVALAAAEPGLSTAVLRAELARVTASPIVLNRALREATLAEIETRRLSMSEIAIRCGRIKRDSRGNASGETSWLARRLGLLAEAGQSAPTPWIHTDVLALIAREGLGISPREVELG